MTWLSALRLHPRDSFVARDLADLTQMHRTVMSAFPEHDGRAPRQAFGVLFRAEVPVAGEAPPLLLVQSAVEPDWGALPVGYSLSTDVKSVDEQFDAVDAGDALRFRLDANPTMKRARGSDGASRHSRREPLFDPADRHAWLTRKAEQSGFEYVGGAGELNVVDLPPSGPGGRGRDGVHVRAVRVDGALRVLDADRFREALRSGVGPARAYGCGLLTVAPLR